jgi:hypothetical protein
LQTFTFDQINHADAVRLAMTLRRAFHWVPQTAARELGWSAVQRLRWLPVEREGHVLADYRLPDGRVVSVDDTACKGLPVIDFALADGSMVQAVRLS